MNTVTTVEMLVAGETLTLTVSGVVEPRRSGYRGRVCDSFVDEGGVTDIVAVNDETGEEVNLDEWQMERAAEALMKVA